MAAPAAAALGLNDPVIDVALTPNRGDCASVYGIARDLAAAGIGTLKDGAVAPVKGAFPSPIKVSLDFPESAASACTMFAGRLIRGVKNGPSPKWVQDRLKAVGLRPISALVDVTNLIAQDRGRPLHVFDAAKLKGNMRARLAKPGEKLVALDGKTYTLDAEMTVIADDAAARGIAGVMGGEDSSCTEATTDVFVESAMFDPTRTARTGRTLGIVSDARYRFERGVDPEFVVPVSNSRRGSFSNFAAARRPTSSSPGRRTAWRAHDRLPVHRAQAAGRHRSAARRNRPYPDESRVSRSPAAIRWTSRRRPGARTSMGPRTWSRRSSASTGSTRFRRRR